MKVWINTNNKPWEYGLAIIAANSAEEAHDLLMSSEGHPDIAIYQYYFRPDGWIENSSLTANVDRPTIIAITAGCSG